MTASRRSRLLLGLLALCIVLADQATKHAAAAMLAGASPLEILPVFQLLYTENAGAAFGMLADAGAIGRYSLALFSLIAVGFLTWWLLAWRTLGLLEGWAASFLLGGAAGNLIDRAATGRVIDFLYFHVGEYGFPAFNLADASLTVGVLVLAADLLLRKRSQDG